MLTRAGCVRPRSNRPATNDRRVDADREADPLRGRNHRGVHADDFAATRDERPAGVTGVQRRVGLNDVVDETTGPTPKRAPERAHDACGDRALKPEGVPDRDDELPDAQRGRIPDGHRGEVLLPRLDDRDVRVRIVPDEIRGHRIAAQETVTARMARAP